MSRTNKTRGGRYNLKHGGGHGYLNSHWTIKKKARRLANRATRQISKEIVRQNTRQQTEEELAVLEDFFLERGLDETVKKLQGDKEKAFPSRVEVHDGIWWFF